ncbi:MAG: hypothetical protein AVDCRST_MAG56-4390 [uncultured Cytophagales bacterium]|uniref:Uncharacterized protein n=1 Tax=uncultured Cytophagales bacterium TaxID=158755 RepID=A0A6J4JU87_9SPHI|nr:MAG: hypothetical protein AVDCRST_MAG56-4390 [uncultured Cytophagales bacterium]
MYRQGLGSSQPPEPELKISRCEQKYYTGRGECSSPKGVKKDVNVLALRRRTPFKTALAPGRLLSVIGVYQYGIETIKFIT